MNALCRTLIAASLWAGCKGSEPEAPAAPEPGAAVEQVPPPVAEAEPAPLPVAEDFEAQAEATIDADNYAAQLDAIDEELRAEGAP